MKKMYLYITLIVFFCGCGFDCDTYLNKEIKPRLIDGRVVQKSKSTVGCFGSITFKSGDNIDTLSNICYCVPENQKLWEIVSVGDSIYKKEGALIIKVYKDGKAISFDYPCCDR